MDSLAGRTLGPYRIIAYLGAGAMASVYKAHQPTIDRFVAIKVLPPHLAQDPTFRARFQREAHTIARLEHRSILPVYDAGEADGIYYLVMRYADSGTLEDLIRSQSLSIERTLQLIRQVAEALAYAHTHGVTHRDIKPSNVLIGRDGNALLTDFGIAKIIGQTQQLTSDGTIIGTPAYMAPEQIQGQAVDGRADIYALGAVLYQAITGECPFTAETPLTLAYMQLHHAPRPPRQLNPAIPEALEQMTLRALAKDPAQRFQTADELAQALRAVSVKASEGPPIKAPAAVNTARPKYPLALGALLALVLLGTAFAVRGFSASSAHQPATAVAQIGTTTAATRAPLATAGAATIAAAPTTAPTAEGSAPGALAPTSAIPTPLSTYEDVLRKKKVVAIVRNDTTPLSRPSSSDPSQREGFEIDVMKEIARRWFEDEHAVEFLPVDSPDRIPTLQGLGTTLGDIVAAALSITNSRPVDFSIAYFQDGQRLLIRQDDASMIWGVCNLQGKQIGVIRNAVGSDTIKKEASSRCGYRISDDQLIPYDKAEGQAGAIESLAQGTISAFTTDNVLLESYSAAQPGKFKVVGNDFSEELYGLAVRKDKDGKFQELVNVTLQVMQRDGTFGAIYCKWFGADGSQPLAIRSDIAPIADSQLKELTETHLQPKFANQCSVPNTTEYTVQSGDTLRDIAKKFYGNSSPKFWQLIYDTNKTTIGPDPDRIRSKITLKIPASPSS